MHIKFFIISLHYTEACNELAGPYLRHCALETSPFEKMLQGWRAVGDFALDLTGQRFEPLASRSKDERVTA